MATLQPEIDAALGLGHHGIDTLATPQDRQQRPPQGRQEGLKLRRQQEAEGEIDDPAAAGGVEAEDDSVGRRLGGKNRSPPATRRQDHQGCHYRFDPSAGERVGHQPLLPVAIGRRRQMLQGAAAAIGEMGTGRLGSVGAIGQALEDAGTPPALAFTLQPDAQAVAGGGIRHEDGASLDMTDAVACKAQGRDLDLGCRTGFQTACAAHAGRLRRGGQ